MAGGHGEPAVAGKMPRTLSAFRPSSQDGQYQPFEVEEPSGTATLKLGESRATLRYEEKSPNATSPPAKFTRMGDVRQPRPPVPGNEDAPVTPAREKPTNKRKGWVDLPRSREPEPHSPTDPWKHDSKHGTGVHVCACSIIRVYMYRYISCMHASVIRD